jgi:exonuclease SbcC
VKISKVKLTNFCQYTEKEVVLPPGILGVLGPNGSGKSNLVRGILRGLTGASGNWGKKEDDLRWGSDKGSVRVDFEAGGKAGHIQRDLLTARCSMEYSDQKYKTATDVDAAIYSIIGVSPRLLDEMVFVQQGAIEGVLFSKPAERAKSFQALFGTERAEKLREVLQEEAQGIVIASRAEALADARARHALAAADLQKSGLELEAARKLVLAPGEARSMADQIALFHTEQANLRIGEEAASLIKSHGEQFGALEAQREGLAAKRGEVLRVLEELRPLCAEARVLLSSYEALNMAASERARWQALRETAKAVLARTAPVAPARDTQAEETLKVAREEFSVAASVEKAFKERKGTCPTCRQPVSDELVREYAAKAAALLPELKRLEALVSRDQEQTVRYLSAAATYNAERHRAGLDTAEAKTRLEQLPEKALPSESAVKDARELTNDYALTEKSCAELSLELSGVAARRDAAADNLARERLRLGTLKQPTVLAADFAAYQRALEEHQRALARATEVSVRVDIQRKSVEEYAALIARYEVEEAQMQRLKSYKDLCEKARAVLHRDCLPNLVARGYLRLLNAGLAKYLEIFGVPFTSRLNDDLSISCVFGGRQEPSPAERLSGGQKVALGIAFRFAVYELFTANLGVLVLDEPTVYLDHDRVDSVFRLLEHVRTYSKSAGLQVIVVTHEERLAGVFDGVIRL